MERGGGGLGERCVGMGSRQAASSMGRGTSAHVEHHRGSGRERKQGAWVVPGGRLPWAQPNE
jgi:hypothetical protein